MCVTRRKQRLTVTVHPDVVEAGKRAVRAGEADSLSGWVGQAMFEKAERAAKLRALAAAIKDYEREFGAITAEEMSAQRRADRESATIVRGRKPKARGTAAGSRAKASGVG